MELPSSPCGAYWEPDGKQHVGYGESIRLLLMDMFLEGKHFATISRGHACKWPVQLDHFDRCSQINRSFARTLSSFRSMLTPTYLLVRDIEETS